MCYLLLLLLSVVCTAALKAGELTRLIPIKPLAVNVSQSSAVHHNVSAMSRVIGGKIAPAHWFPYQVAILISSSDGSGIFFCGGSLIHDEWILTAAHCVDNVPGTVEVLLGTHYISWTELQSQVIFSTSEIHVHPLWDRYDIKNDIALIRLSSRVQLSTDIDIVKLPSHAQQSSSFVSKVATLTGWGKTSDASDMSPVLMYVKGTIMSNSKCSKFFGQVHDSNICLSGSGGVGGCSGDSGGPLVIDDVDGNRTQVGIVSFGTQHCVPGYPTAFTRVTSYSEWISSVTGASVLVHPCLLFSALTVLLPHLLI